MPETPDEAKPTPGEEEQTATPTSQSDAPAETTPSEPVAPAAAETPAVEAAAESASTPSVEAPPATEAAPVQPAPAKGASYSWGTGRRKTSVARVRVRPGTGKFLIHKREINDYFFDVRSREDVIAPLRATGTMGKYDVFVNVKGGGQTGQSGAIVLGLARALVNADSSLEGKLRDGKYLTRDSRKVERKKPGQPGARKRFQFSKR
jgi:small subunit ribosomal protein S9